MIPMAAMRRMAPLLVGLFFAAQIFGVVPLISCHSAHAAGAFLVVCECNGSTDTLPVRHHHPGDSDDSAQHHALQDLNGVLVCSPDRREIALVHTAITIRAPSALAEADPIRLERPPKPLLSV